MEKAYFYGGIPENWAEDSFQECGKLTICYRKLRNEWARLGGSWNGIPLLGLDKFYTEKRDHYSFGNSAASFGYPANYRIPRQRYVDILHSIISGSYYYAIGGNWNGSCYGMAGTTLEFYENENFQVTDYNKTAENLYALTAPGSKDAALTKLIEAYQISQCKGAITGCGGLLSRNMGKYLEMIQKVEEFERSGGLSVDAQAEPILLMLYSYYGAHVVVPVSVEQAENGDFEMKVYDPNDPSAMQTLVIKKDFSEISYKFYMYASYLDYSVVAAAMSDVELHSETAKESLYLSIDKEDGIVEDKDGKGIDEIEGAYEQKLFQTGEEDVFSGIRSFVLPKGDYTLTAAESESSADTNEDSTFYLATDEYFAEITSSDEHAELEVNQTEEDSIVFTLKSESVEKETAQLILVNTEGMERNFEIEGSSATVTVAGDDTITVEVPEQKKVSMDGQQMEVTNGQLVSSFISSDEEKPFKTRDSEININCDAKNKLNGTIDMAVLSGDAVKRNVTITASFLTQDGKRAASYSKEIELNPGRNYITLSLQQLETAFAETEGEVKLLCEIEIKDESGESLRFSEGDFTVHLTKQEQNPEPGPEDPEPGPEDPEDPEPGPEDPEPGPEDPEPGPEDPEPGPEDPEDPEPGPEDPEPGPENPDDTPVVPVTQIKINKKNLILGVGESFVLEALAFPGNATDKTLKFQAMNDRVEVSEEGKITAKKPGVSYILVKSAYQKQEIVTVTVKNAPEIFTLNVAERKLNPGEHFQIELNLPADTASNRITYSSSDVSVASVSKEGIVTAGKEGKAVITVETFNGKKAEMQIIVKTEIPVSEVKVLAKKLTLGKGESCMLGASVLPKNATDKTLVYAASNDKVSISPDGKIKAKKTGTCRITVRAANGESAKVTVSVKKPPKKITLNASKKTLKRGRYFTVKVRFSNNTASHKITFSSNKKSVASVNSKGRIKARKKGKAVITAKTFNGKKAKIKITVK